MSVGAETQVEAGRQLYLEGCSSCHGLRGPGHRDRSHLDRRRSRSGQLPGRHRPHAAGRPGRAGAPPSRLSTPTRRSPQLAAYIATLAPGPAIPTAEQIDYTDADVAYGGELFRINCSQCHQAAGEGGALTQGKYAPNLMEATPREIYEAMLTGPQNMPVFSDAQLPTPRQAGHHRLRPDPAGVAEPRRPEPRPLRPRHRGRVPRRPQCSPRSSRRPSGSESSRDDRHHAHARATPDDTEAKPGHSPVADVPHRLRLTDTDPKAARRAERQVTSMFLLSMLFTVLFVVAYVAIDKSTTIYIPVIGRRRRQPTSRSASRSAPRSSSSAPVPSSGPRSSCPTSRSSSSATTRCPPPPTPPRPPPTTSAARRSPDSPATG